MQFNELAHLGNDHQSEERTREEVLSINYICSIYCWIVSLSVILKTRFLCIPFFVCSLKSPYFIMDYSRALSLDILYRNLFQLMALRNDNVQIYIFKPDTSKPAYPTVSSTPIIECFIFKRSVFAIVIG